MKRNFEVELDDNPQIKGLKQFKDQLEKDYYSDVQIRDCSTVSNVCYLIIELKCNLRLEEAVYLLKQEGWGSKQASKSCLKEAIGVLENQNSFDIQVEEFSLFLLDTSIIIKRIHQRSIEEQLYALLYEIAEHHPSITKKSAETPYEIYIPVFEEDILENDRKITAIEEGKNESKDYFTYWGLYFDSENDAVIYELPKRRIFSADLFMLNH